MGYVLLGVGAAGLIANSDAQARELAVTGAVTQMVSHGLLTGALFLLAGVLYERGRTYGMAAYGGLAGPAPRFAAFTALAAFASLGLPGFSGFVAEFQIFTGALDAQPVATAIATVGILITAALFLLMIQRMLLGPLRTPGGPGATTTFADLRPSELAAVGPLLLLALVIGVAPRFLLDVIEPASRTVVELVAR
jgi:NADH-quinone oxidoreductase subunit M